MTSHMGSISNYRCHKLYYIFQTNFVTKVTRILKKKKGEDTGGLELRLKYMYRFKIAKNIVKRLPPNEKAITHSTYFHIGTWVKKENKLRAIIFTLLLMSLHGQQHAASDIHGHKTGCYTNCRIFFI